MRMELFEDQEAWKSHPYIHCQEGPCELFLSGQCWTL